MKPLNWNDRLVLFVGHLIREGKKSTTIKCYISAVKAVLKCDGVPGGKLNENLYLLTALTRVCKLKNDIITMRLPIRRGMLNILLKEFAKIFQEQPYLQVMYQALFSTTYEGLFRIGEIMQSEHVIKARDVHVARNKKKMMFVLHSSKTHTKGDKSQIVKIQSIKPNSTELNSRQVQWCPFGLLRKFLEVRQGFVITDEQFFIFRDGTPVTPAHMRCMLQKLLISAGMDTSVYQVHGLRTGKASDLLQKGVSVETIKKLGRWRSNAVFTYL